jgi:phosphate-selective porin
MRLGKLSVLCLAALLPGLLRADGPEDAAPVPETPASPPTAAAVEYIPLRGVVFRTADRLFELAIGANLQFRFTNFKFDDVPNAQPDADEFRVRRFKLYLTGYAFDPHLTYRFQVAFENVANGKLLLDDAWLNYRFMDEVSAQGGQSKTPYSRDELFNDGVIQFQERAAAVDAFKPGRDIGAGFTGTVGKGLFVYYAAVFGGVGQTTLRATDHVMPMLRLVVNPLGELGQGEADLDAKPDPRISVGVDGFTNTLKKIDDRNFESNVPNYASSTGWLGRGINLFRTGENVAIRSASADVQFKWSGFSAQAEYFLGRAEGDTGGAILRAKGWYGQVGYLVVPGKLDIALRDAAVDSNRAVSRDVVSTVTGAIDYYFRRHNVKLQGEYSRVHRQLPAGGAANDKVFRLQAQLML